MISGSKWPIPMKELMDGAILTLKNADDLATEAEILFKKRKYSRSLSLATLSLEEFGKHGMLMEAMESNCKITKKIWHDEFENHTMKLEVIPKRLKKFTNPKDKKKLKNLERINKYLLKLSKKKLEAFYVDWNAKNNTWFVFDRIHSKSELKKMSKEAVYSATFVVKKYIEDVGGEKDLILTPMTELLKLFRKKKVHGFCDFCSRLCMNPPELLSHSRICGKVVSWYWN